MKRQKHGLSKAAIAKLKPETQLQIAVIEWIRWVFPEAARVTMASAGGLITTDISALIMVEMGYQKGTPDLNIAYPVDQYHGLYVELKTPQNSQKRGSPDQQELLERLRLNGYYACVCVGFQEAILTIEHYLGGDL